MRVVVLGGGPAGLYFSLLLRKARPDVEVELYERNAADDTFGWGVVFSDQTLENFRLADATTYDAITQGFAHWDDIDVHFKGRTITSSGHGFSGIARRELLDILQRRASELGVALHFNHEIPEETAFPDATLVVAADGVNSSIRRRHADAFGADVDPRHARYIWLGTTLPLDAFTFIVIENAYGVFQAHAYRFNETHSTFIVECDEASWRAAGFERMDAAATVAACETMFAPWLKGHPLLYNATPHRSRDPWINFARIRCDRWRLGRTVLLGDSAHTAHFSIGSGTKLAMEDAIVLAREVAAVQSVEPAGTELPDNLAHAVDRYIAERQVEVLRLQNAARNSMEWFENVKRYVGLEPEQFAYSLLTRSQRVSHENLRLRDRTWTTGMERWFASRAAQEASVQRAAEDGVLPMLTPFRLRDLVLPNRIVVAPMDMYAATDGLPNDFHLVHYGSRAMGGAALVMTEMTCVTPEGRITPGCTGIYRDDQTEAWRRITSFVHANSGARMCLQLGHSGRKGSVRSGLTHDMEPLPASDAWPVMGPSALRHHPALPVPREMTRADMEAVRDAFAIATRRAVKANFDMLELHCAHGYLLSSFITPLANQRRDDFGGTLQNRLRFPLEVFSAMRAIWPAERPMSVRISATDWVTGGVTGDDAVAIARAFVDAGADILHVSTGQTSPDAKPVYGRMWQTPFADRIRNELGIRTIAVGSITDADQVNSILMAGRADLCALGRPHLADPYWTLHEGTRLGASVEWPEPYASGGQQLARLRS